MIIIFLLDDYKKAEHFVKNDIVERGIIFPQNETYTIVNMKHIVFCFTNVKPERKYNNIDCCYIYYSYLYETY